MKTRNIRSLNRQKEQKKSKFVFLAVFLAVAVLVGGYYFIRHGIVVDEVVFVDNQHLRNDELKGLLKIKKNDELFGISGREIFTGLKRSPWIKDTVIRKEFSGLRTSPGPGLLKGRVLIKVTEAVPAAILSLGGISFLVDRDGTVLEQIRESALFLPVIKDIDPRSNRETYMEAMKFVNVLHEKKVPASGGNIVISGQRPEDISLTIDNVSIKVGAGDFEKKLSRLKLVKDEIEKKNMLVEYIDVRFSNRIIVKPAGHAPAVSEKTDMAGDGKKKQ